ncbi:hypothetical protein M3Y99_01042300 [Aphelenchoides fujianensis]|nr:hypothetical protein M3Y99_01042300 [Aphelenchoides fujianensis]
MLRNKNRTNQSEIPEENRDPEMSDSESNEAAVEEPKASGVALNPEQYEALKGLLETIDEQVASA